MKLTVPMFSEQDRHGQRGYVRHYVRAVVDFRMIAKDKAGLATGQVMDMTTKGCGLRFIHSLNPGQYLPLTMSTDNGSAAVQCNLIQVQWIKEDRTGVALLSMSPENERRLHQLCGDQLRREQERVPGLIRRRVAGLLRPHAHSLPTRFPQDGRSGLRQSNESRTQGDLHM